MRMVLSALAVRAAPGDSGSAATTRIFSTDGRRRAKRHPVEQQRDDQPPGSRLLPTMIKNLRSRCML
jgi:hypothetical protein